MMDENVAALYRQEFSQQPFEMTFFTFPSGESSKTREMKQRIEDQMLCAHFGRDCAVIAVGGGVTTDLGGFIAATYCRGVPWISVPTTLIGMVDASIGGKTGVNTPFGKNLIGAFYPPKLVVMDLNSLQTLPEREVQYGWAEVLKMGFILDPTLLELPLGEELIKRCYQRKMEIVEQDYQESGRRRILNFGHTLGHAIEHLEGYTIHHGAAIAMGMILESMMSFELGYLKRTSLLRLIQILQNHRLSLPLPASAHCKALLQSMSYDKKGVRFVVLKEIGEVEAFGSRYCLPVEPKVLEKVCGDYATLIH